MPNLKQLQKETRKFNKRLIAIEKIVVDKIERITRNERRART